MHMIQRNKALLWFLIASNQKLVHKDLSLRNQKMVEDDLSKHYPCSKIPVGSSCSMAHLVHGLIEICRWRLPFPWVHTAAIVIVGMVTVHLGILYSETHWALSVHHKDADHMMIYDGNNNEDIAAKALEWPQCRASMMSGVADTDFYWPQIKCWKEKIICLQRAWTKVFFSQKMLQWLQYVLYELRREPGRVTLWCHMVWWGGEYWKFFFSNGPKRIFQIGTSSIITIKNDHHEYWKRFLFLVSDKSVVIQNDR